MGLVSNRLGVVMAAAGLACAAGTAMAQAPGADVVLADIQSVASYGPIDRDPTAGVDNVWAYSIGSHTCNVGTQSINWTSYGTPGLAMNLYRLHNGRLMQIGLGFAKTACCAAAGTSTLCGGTCNGPGGSQLGPSCLDVYGAGYNAGQGHLSPRSAINGFTGVFSTFVHDSGDAVYRRLQARQADMDPATYPGALFFVEGHYQCTEDANGSFLNNLTYRRVNIGTGASGAYTMSLPTTNAVLGREVSAITAWRAHGLGINQPDARVNVSMVGIPNEGVFHYAYKVTELGNGRWRYDYAIQNINSDKCAGSFSVPIIPGTSVSNAGFSAPKYHSSEPYSNANWALTVSGDSVTWATPETYAQNPNASALRWGTMANFWFETDTPPAAANVAASMGVFKPHTTQSVTVSVRGPGGPTCNMDYNADGGRDNTDVSDLANDIASGTAINGDFHRDGGADNADVTDLANAIATGSCPA